jgi:MFS family permease
MILVGLFGDRFARFAGRRLALWLGAGGVVGGFLLIASATTPIVSLAGFALIGSIGALIPAIIYPVLADTQGSRRDMAFSEANATSSAFAILAPVLMAAALALALSWKAPLLIGAAAGVVVLLVFRGVAVPGQPAAPPGRRLPAPYWAYWCLIAVSVGIEFCVFLWSPTVFEHVTGLPRDQAAAAAIVFFLAMLIGRLAGSRLLRRVPAKMLFVVALGVAAAGFALYWGGQGALPVVIGLFVVGLGVALFFPLALGLAVAAANDNGAAGARMMVAVGAAVMVLPATLGWLADEVGLHNALLLIPVLILLAFVCLVVGDILQRRVPVMA